MKKVLFVGVLIGACIGAYFGLSRDAHFVRIDATGFRATYLVADPDATEATAHLIVQAGEMDNNGPEGLAHYLEHLAWIDAFQGGAQGADRHANAWTNVQATVYWEAFGPSELGRAIGRLRRVLDTPDLDANFALQERDIVQREYDLRILENPYVSIWNDVSDVLFEGTPYARSVIGTPESIASYTEAAALALHSQTHRPENAVLVIYGDFSERQVKSALGAGHLDATATSPVPWSDLNFTALTDVAEVQAKITAPTLIYQKLIKRPRCATQAECDAIMVLLKDALDSELPGGVAGPLRFDNFLARSFDLDVGAIGNDGVVLSFVAETDRGVTPQELRAAFEEVLLTAALPTDTIEKIRNRQLNGFDSDLTPRKTTYGRLIYQISERADPYDVLTARNAFAAAKVDDVRLLHEAIRDTGRTVVRYILPIQ